ncbi:MAG: class I SAM-dependent methyltransferase [Pseudomonadota bacterium]
MTRSPQAAPGSFRDPQGKVIEYDGRIFRALFRPAAKFPETWSVDGPLAPFVAAGTLWPSWPLHGTEVPAELRVSLPEAVGFLEHPRLAPITFPYEWPFELLKRAALLHLDFHRALLKLDLTLSDGFAYNVQFVGARPVFLDALAIVPYVAGQPWAGYAQFCESFLNPLLLAARGCESWQEMYRGRLRGVSTRETARQLGLWGALRAGAFMHVILNSQSEPHGGADPARKLPRFSRDGLDLLLASLESCIRKLSLPATRGAHWGDYECDNSYSAPQRQIKHSVVEEFARRLQPNLLLDVGCNAGEYSEVALAAGARSVVGLERDVCAVNLGVARADTLKSRFLPLQVDLQNSSPAQGWNLEERQSLHARLAPDAVLCLALIHHLVLGDGVPLELAVQGIVALAPAGIIEFVPLEDPMARRIAGLPERLIHRYDLATFMSSLSGIAEIKNSVRISDHGRVLVEYRREPGSDSPTG